MSEPQEQPPHWDSASGKHDAPRQADRRTLDYRSARDDKFVGLTGGQFFGQVIGGIVMGIAVCVGLFAGGAGVLAVGVPIAVGIALCFVPRVRGLGIGMCLALPLALLVVLGLCFASGTKF